MTYTAGKSKNPLYDGVRIPVGFKMENSGVLLTDYIDEIVEDKPKFFVKRLYDYSTGEYSETICTKDEIDNEFFNEKIEFPYIAVFYAVYENVEIVNAKDKRPEGYSC